MNYDVVPPGDELLVRLEELAWRYQTNHLPDHARGVLHALREAKVYFAREPK